MIDINRISLEVAWKYTVSYLWELFNFLLVDFVLKDPREKEEDKKAYELPPHRAE